MLTQEPLHDSPSPPSGSRAGPSRATTLALTLVVLLVLVLRHDYWQWDTPHPLLFGFLPAGLWWQGLVSLLAAGMMALMVRFAWPASLEQDAIESERRRTLPEPHGRQSPPPNASSSNASSSNPGSNGDPKHVHARSAGLTR